VAKRAPPNWHPLVNLATRVLRDGKPLALTTQVVSVLRNAARTVAISEAETKAALQSVRSAKALLRKIREDRIRKGSNRLGDALLRMYKLRDGGDIEGAREQMRKVLAVEVVPFYRWVAQGQLDQLDDWDPSRSTATTPRNTSKARKTTPRKATPSAKPGKARKTTPGKLTRKTTQRGLLIP